MSQKRSTWSSQTAFMLAAAASAVGLGNIWRFPYLAAKYGGGTFLLTYIILTVTFGFSLMVAEIAIGRKTGKSALSAFSALRKRYGFIGWILTIIPLVIVPYYCVIGGWVAKYIVTYAQLLVNPKAEAAQALVANPEAFFTDFIGSSSSVAPMIYGLIFIVLSAIVIILGVRKGIEISNKVMMPLLIIMSLGIAIYSLTRPGAMEGLKFYLIPNTDSFYEEVVIEENTLDASAKTGIVDVASATTEVADVASATTEVADVAPTTTEVADVAPATTEVADAAPATTEGTDAAPATTEVALESTQNTEAPVNSGQPEGEECNPKPKTERRFSFVKLSKTILGAMGQMFYSLSLAMGIMITYGSYFKKDGRIEKSVRVIEIFDTAIAFIAGLMIIPAVFAFSGGAEKINAGPGLMFISLPSVFANGQTEITSAFSATAIIGLLFFILVFFAALTSAISLFETCVASICDITHINRKTSIPWCLVIIILLSIPSALGYGVWGKIEIFGLQFLDFFDAATNDVLMPIGALLTCLFIGWVIGPKTIIEEVDIDGHGFSSKGLFIVMIKFIAPLLIILIFASNILKLLGIYKI